MTGRSRRVATILRNITGDPAIRYANRRIELPDGYDLRVVGGKEGDRAHALARSMSEQRDIISGVAYWPRGDSVESCLILQPVRSFGILLATHLRASEQDGRR